MAAFATPSALVRSGTIFGAKATGGSCVRGPQVRVALTASLGSDEGRRVSRRAFGAALAATLVGASVAPVHAERTVATRKLAYDRYYPRIKIGGDELRSVGEALKNGDMAAALAVTESKEFDVKFRRALSIYATSFSDSTLNQQSLDLMRCQTRLFDELAKLKGADPEQAVASYNISCEAYEKYVKIARLPKELVTPAFPKL